MSWGALVRPLSLIHIWGIKINVRITEVAETYQQNMEEIDITFGESLPALITQIRQITK